MIAEVGVDVGWEKIADVVVSTGTNGAFDSVGEAVSNGHGVIVRDFAPSLDAAERVVLSAG